MAAHRGDDQQLGRAFGQALAPEVAQRAERLFEHDRLGNRKALPRDLDVLDVEGRLAAFGIEMREDLQGTRHDWAGAEIAHRQGRVAEQLGADFGPVARAIEPGPLQFVGIVKQSGSPAA